MFFKSDEEPSMWDMMFHKEELEEMDDPELGILRALKAQNEILTEIAKSLKKMERGKP